MKFRCYYSKTPKHMRAYRNKGVKIYEGWLEDAASFDRWALANGWREGLTIDRISSAGDYCPHNCQFITHEENNQKSASAKLNADKVREIRKLAKKGMTLASIAPLFGVSARTISNVVARHTWDNIK